MPRPKHEHVREELRKRYIDNQPADLALPTERALAEEFAVNRATVRHALSLLEADGLVYRIQGAGTFTVGQTIAKSLKLTSFSEDIRSRGMVPSTKLISAGERPAGDVVGQALRISPVEPIVQLTRVRLANAEPMCIETVSLRAGDVPGILAEDLEGSLYELLQGRYGITVARAEQVVTSTVVEPEQATLLGVPPLWPALRVRRTSVDARSRPLEHAVSLYRSDRYEIRFTVRRDQ